MATIQLRNLTGRTLNRTSLAGTGYTIEPPERVELDATAQWTATDSGSAGYTAASATDRQLQDSVTLSWQFEAAGQFRFSARSGRGRLKVRTQASGDACTYIVARQRRRLPIPPRAHVAGRPLIPIVPATVITLIASAALAAGVLATRQSSPGPLPTPTATQGQTTLVATPTASATATAAPRPTATTAPRPTATSTTVPRSASLAVYSSTVSIPAASTATGSVSCHGGEYLVAGGYAGTDFGVNVTSSYPSNASTWTVVAGDSSGSGGKYLTVYAVCLRANFPVAFTTVSNTQPIAGYATATVSASCPSGSIPTGGGFVLGYETLFGSFAQASAWSVTAENALNISNPLQAFAVCSRMNLRAAGISTKSVPVAAGTIVSSSLACGAGQLLTVGGYTNNGYNPDAPPIMVATQPSDARSSTWAFAIYGQYSATVPTSAVCISY